MSDYQGARLHPRYQPVADNPPWWTYTCELCGAVGRSDGPWRAMHNYRAHLRRYHP